MPFQKGYTPYNKGLPSHLQGHWKGGKITDKDGYILIKKRNHPFGDNKKYVQEHRLIVEQYIKRFLKPTEFTHHLNGIKNDNKLENLMVFTNESAHQRFHKNPANVKFSEIIFDGRQLL